MKPLRPLACLLLCLAAAPAPAQLPQTRTPDARMLRFPDIDADRIVFVYAGDLWIVAREGGIARRLSSPKGPERFPKFSPDGRWIAFSGNYDGNTDVYVMPAGGGSPVRLTHHPENDLVVDWYPDGDHILFRSRMTSPSRRFNRLFKQPIRGGLPEPLPFPYGELASFSPDGTRMAFQIISREFRTWKRYRGGMASDLWLYDFQNNTSEKLTRFEGTDALPMWHHNTLYFLSDRDDRKKLNIWAHDLASGNTRQITAFSDYDVKWPSLGPDAIVFENGGSLHILDLATETTRPVSIQVPADLPDARPRWKNLSEHIDDFGISPTGKRALLEARGEILTLPAEHGSPRNLTNTSGAMERDPAWSPDGKHIAYLSDRSGEYELTLKPADGKGNERPITSGGNAFRYTPVWSPDSKKIAFNDKTGALFFVNLDTGKPTLVDRDEWFRITAYDWSPDSRWLAYAKRMPNEQGAIRVYDTRERKTYPITGDYYHEQAPVFDPEGKYLYFYSDRTFRPVYGDTDATWIYPNATGIYAITLRKDVDSPLAPRSDEEETREEDKKENPEEEKSDKKEDKKKTGTGVEPIEIDFETIETRIVELPVDPGNFGRMKAVKGKVVFHRRPEAGVNGQGSLKYYDLEKREEKTILEKIDGFDISADGKKIIYKNKSAYGIVDPKENQKAGDGKLDTGNLNVWIDPHREWRQIFTDAWRIQRDFFYDPDMHGVNWPAVRDRYAALLPYVTDREDLNYVIGEMIAELNASHTYVGGGDIERPETVPVGLLGCDFELDRAAGAYRISKIYAGGPWGVDDRSPLRRPGITVAEGDYLLAVNGRPLDTARDPWAAFQGLAGKTVPLTLNGAPTTEGAREILVEPASSEFRLRNLAWIESNRKKVEQATGGRVGYIYVPDTGRNGQNELVRQFIPQRTREGLIIDERFNGGGQVPDRFIELLNRPLYNYWARRDTRDWQSPFVAHTGPKVMLINEWAGSGGDAFPYYFKKAGLGPLIGKRTWGGLIGISGSPRLIDGGYVTAPSFGFWNTEGRWDVEGYGVDPDYEIENPPHELAAGRDPQLEKAIEIIQDLLKTRPPPAKQKPAYPDRSK